MGICTNEQRGWLEVGGGEGVWFVPVALVLAQALEWLDEKVFEHQASALCRVYLAL